MKFALVAMLIYMISYFSTKYFIKLSWKLDMLDKPNPRKKHSAPTPILGGSVLYIGLVTVYLIGTLLFNYEYNPMFLVGISIIFFIGLIDDIKKTRGSELSAGIKAVGQIGATLIIISGGTLIEGFTIPFANTYFFLPVVLQVLLSVIWIFGLTTVINFIDGIDGLALSQVGVSSVALFILACITGEFGYGLLMLGLISSVIALLRFNLPPAKIFIGDSGATMLGFMLGICSIDGVMKQATFISIVAAFLIFALPIVDNVFVVLSRIKDGQAPYTADRRQIHLKLKDKGYEVPFIVKRLSAISVLFCGLAIVLFIFVNI